MELSNAQRAEVLIHALPYIQKYYNKIIVVKYGGNAMINEELKKAVMGDIVLLSLIGIKVVLVHGGGPEISEMLQKIGKRSEFVNGLRVTDADGILKQRNDFMRLVAEIHSQVKRDLIISASCGMKPLAGISDPLRKLRFHKHMDIFAGTIDLQLSCIQVFENPLQSGDNLLGIFSGNNIPRAKHRGMRHRARDILPVQL